MKEYELDELFLAPEASRMRPTTMALVLVAMAAALLRTGLHPLLTDEFMWDSTTALFIGIFVEVGCITMFGFYLMLEFGIETKVVWLGKESLYIQKKGRISRWLGNVREVPFAKIKSYDVVYNPSRAGLKIRLTNDDSLNVLCDRRFFLSGEFEYFLTDFDKSYEKYLQSLSVDEPVVSRRPTSPEQTPASS